MIKHLYERFPATAETIHLFFHHWNMRSLLEQNSKVLEQYFRYDGSSFLNYRRYQQHMDFVLIHLRPEDARILLLKANAVTLHNIEFYLSNPILNNTLPAHKYKPYQHLLTALTPEDVHTITHRLPDDHTFWDLLTHEDSPVKAIAQQCRDNNHLPSL